MIETDKLNTIKQLRNRIIKEVDEDTLKRIKENPRPSELEILIGAFYEMLEPQIRDALLVINDKGYSTESSGFYGEHGEYQCMDGYFKIDKITRNKLEKFGVKILNRDDLGYPGESSEWTRLRFSTEKPDIKTIKVKWDKIAEILPDNNCKAFPSVSGASEEFRKKYAKSRIDIQIKSLEKRLKLNIIHPRFVTKYKNKLQKLKEECV